MNLIVLLHLPNIAITSMDADHLDIYGTSDAIKESFKFANKVK
jgi:UDP-N-acetylmuramate--alanine ligase